MPLNCGLFSSLLLIPYSNSQRTGSDVIRHSDIEDEPSRFTTSPYKYSNFNMVSKNIYEKKRIKSGDLFLSVSGLTV